MRLGCRWDLQKLTDALRAEPCGTGGRGTPQGRRQTHWSWTGPAKQIEVDARIAKNGAKVVIHLPSLVVAPEFHGDCCLRNHHFLQATIVHVGANTLERTGTTSTSRVPPVRISRHPLKKKRAASNVPLGSVNWTVLFNTVESPGCSRLVGCSTTCQRRTALSCHHVRVKPRQSRHMRTHCETCR